MFSPYCRLLTVLCWLGCSHAPSVALPLLKIVNNLRGAQSWLTECRACDSSIYVIQVVNKSPIKLNIIRVKLLA